MNAVKEAIVEGISAAFGRPLRQDVISAEELAAAARLHGELGSDAFVEDGDMGVSSPASRPSTSSAQDCRP